MCDKKTANITAFLFSACGLFQLPAQRIQCVTALLYQYVRSIGEMFQIVTLSIFHAQAGDAVEQIARSFDSVNGGFEKIGSSSFSVDVQRAPDAEVALKRVELGHGLNSV
jgi:hypothetical protein